MSKTMQVYALMLGWMIAAAGTAVVGADDEKTSAPEKVLNGKGLTKDDRKFLLDEAAAVEKYQQAKAAYADYQKAFKRYAEIVQYDEAVLTMEANRQAANRRSRCSRCRSTAWAQAPAGCVRW